MNSIRNMRSVRDLSDEPWVSCNFIHVIICRLYDDVYQTRNAITGALETVKCDGRGRVLRYGDVVHESKRSVTIRGRGIEDESVEGVRLEVFK